MWHGKASERQGGSCDHMRQVAPRSCSSPGAQGERERCVSVMWVAQRTNWSSIPRIPTALQQGPFVALTTFRQP